MISVIVPVYNAEKTLRRCVESILSQTDQDFELLLVNDGSTDSSEAICNEYVEKKRRVILLNKVNGWVSSARNLGIDYASGDWLLFVDSDDYIEPDTLSRYKQSISASDVYYVQDYFINKPGLEWKVSFPRRKEKIYLADALAALMSRYHNSVGYIWHCLFNAKMVNDRHIRFNENLQFGEDAVFAFQYIQHMSKGMFIPYLSYHYCDDNPVSLTKTVSFNPEQHYILLREIVTASKQVLLQAEPGRSATVIKSYVMRLLLRGMIYLESTDLPVREEFYRKICSLYDTTLSPGKTITELMYRAKYEGYSKSLAVAVKKEYGKIKVERNVKRQRVIDKLHNLVRIF